MLDDEPFEIWSPADIETWRLRFPEPLRRYVMRDPRDKWLLMTDPTMFSADQLRSAIAEDVFLNILPSVETFDLFQVPLLSEFSGIRLSCDDPGRLTNLGVVSSLTRLTLLESWAELDDGLDLSALEHLEAAGIRGAAGASVLALPRLRSLGVNLPSEPAPFAIRAPLRRLALTVAWRLESLDCVLDPSRLTSLSVTAPNFDMSWLSRFSSLKYLEVSGAHRVTASPESLASLRNLTSITLSEVASVSDADAWFSLPADVGLSVEGNRSFPPHLVRRAKDRDWWIAPYAGDPSAEKDSDRDPSPYYPFTVDLTDTPELRFDSWSAFPERFGDAGPDEADDLHDLLSSLVSDVASAAEIEYIEDSEAQSSIFLLSDESDAIALATRLSTLWRDTRSLVDRLDALTDKGDRSD